MIRIACAARYSKCLTLGVKTKVTLFFPFFCFCSFDSQAFSSPNPHDETCAPVYASGIDFQCDDTKVPPNVLLIGDEIRIQQIMVNLVGNSVKFTSTGGSIKMVLALDPTTPSASGRIITNRVKPPSPYLRHKNDAVLRITVSDTGIGMNAEVMSRLFKPFMQADTGTNRKFGGTGS